MNVGSWVEFYPVAELLASDEVGELIWPSVRVVVLAGLGFGVAVVLCGERPGGGGSPNGRWVLGRVLRLFEWDSFVEPSCLPSGSSSSSPLAMNLALIVVLSLMRLQ